MAICVCATVEKVFKLLLTKYMRSAWKLEGRIVKNSTCNPGELV